MPKLTFNDAALRAIQPGVNQANYWDTLERGLGMRVSPGGTKTFFIYYRHQGIQRRYTLGLYGRLTLAAARRAARIALGDVAKGLDPAGAKKVERDADTFKSLAEKYIEQHAKKYKRSWKEDQRMIHASLLPAWGSRKVVHITRRDIRQVLQGIIARDAP